EIYRFTPWGVMARSEVWAKLAKIITFMAEVVVNHIEHDAERVRMSSVNEALQSVGPAITVLNTVGGNAVISPVACARKSGDWHQFDKRYAQLAQVRQASDSSIECAGGGEGANVQLVDDGIAQRHATPIAICPDEAVGIDNLSGPMHAFRQEP